MPIIRELNHPLDAGIGKQLANGNRKSAFEIKPCS